ncbi:MAG: RNA-binding transcriptional accessory protein, partial [Opitutales bacterium]|nr:RNA-binding transcriptional accessory protein [Opitutales bacterium]
MNEKHLGKLSQELNIDITRVAATAKLLEEKATVPFIARYRKEVTGGLDEVQIAAVRDRLGEMEALDERRTSIVASLQERKLLTAELLETIGAAETLSRLEDIYQPYRPKRRTRAMMAQERGLAPLADYIFEHQDANCAAEAAKFVVLTGEDADKFVPTLEDALRGARDILAERFSDDTDVRAAMRGLFEKDSLLRSKVMSGKEEE